MVSGGDTDLWTWAGIFTCHIHKPVVEYAFTQHRPDMKKAELFLIQHIYNLTFGTENNYFILLMWNGPPRGTQLSGVLLGIQVNREASCCSCGVRSPCQAVGAGQDRRRKRESSVSGLDQCHELSPLFFALGPMLHLSFYCN